MSYDPNLLMSVPIYRIRFRLQDVWDNEEEEFLKDAELEYLLSANGNDEGIATLAAARTIMARSAQYVREREGLIEVYGNQLFDNLKDLIDELEKEFASRSANIIIGGVVRTEVVRVEDDLESVGPGYQQNYLFRDTNSNIGGGSRAVGTRGNRNARDRGFRLRGVGSF